MDHYQILLAYIHYDAQGNIYAKSSTVDFVTYFCCRKIQTAKNLLSLNVHLTIALVYYVHVDLQFLACPATRAWAGSGNQKAGAKRSDNRI